MTLPTPVGARRPHAVPALVGELLNTVMPPRCLGCGEVVESVGGLCAKCWTAVQFATPPQCVVCGLPFPFDPGSDFLCAECVREHPPYARARAALIYGPGSRPMILAFKHRDRTDAAPAFAAWMARAGAELLADADVLIPVPLHWTRLFARRYNQASLLAHALSHLSGIPVAPDILKRKRRTPTQGFLTRSARFRNVRGAFSVPSSHAEAIREKRVLLIDDVMTVGATAMACTAALLKAGAAIVDVLTLARAVKTET